MHASMKNSFQGPWRKIRTAVDHYRSTISLVYNKSDPLPLNLKLLWTILFFLQRFARFSLQKKKKKKRRYYPFSVRLVSSRMARSWQARRCGIPIGLRDGYKHGAGDIYNVNSLALFQESALRLLALSHRVWLLLCNVIHVCKIPPDARCEKWLLRYPGLSAGPFIMDLSCRCLINLPLL